MRALAFLLVLVVLTGCVKSKDAPGTETNTTGNPSDTTTEPAMDPVALAVATTAPYSYDPNTLTVAAGALVNLTYTNNDPVPIQQHNWVLDEAKATTEVIGTGASTSVEFIAPAAGTYTFYCSVQNHRDLGMRGTFTVT